MLSDGSTLRRHSFIKLTAAQFIPVDTYVVRIMAVYDSRLIWVSYTVRPRAAIWLNKWTGMAPIISFSDACWRGCGSRRGGGGVRCVCCRPVSVTARLVRRAYVMGTARNANDEAMFIFCARTILLSTLNIRSRIVTHITWKVVKIKVDEVENILSTQVGMLDGSGCRYYNADKG